MALRGELQDLIEPLVDQPDEVWIEQFRSGRSGVVLEVGVAREDAGKVIGRQGRTVRALRNLLELRGVKDGRRYELEIIDD